MAKEQFCCDKFAKESGISYFIRKNLMVGFVERWTREKECRAAIGDPVTLCLRSMWQTQLRNTSSEPVRSSHLHFSLFRENEPVWHCRHPPITKLHYRGLRHLRSRKCYTNENNGKRLTRINLH